MEIRLVVENGPSNQQEVTLYSFPALIGRHRDCGLRITSRLVSRKHCCLESAAGWLYVRDLSSANGTLVNGTRISGRTILRPGDVLEIGPMRFRLDYEPLTSVSTEIVDHLAAAAATEPTTEILLMATPASTANTNDTDILSGVQAKPTASDTSTFQGSLEGESPKADETGILTEHLAGTGESKPG